MSMLSELLQRSGDARALSSAEFHIRTIKECYELSWFLAEACPNPNIIAVGLTELCINAVEHGNLEIGYELKGQLLVNSKWHDEVKRRLAMPAYRDKFAKVSFEQNARRLLIRIEDEGGGFPWWRYQHPHYQAQAGALHGRGVARAWRLSFNNLTYSHHGSCVEALVHKRS